MPAPPPPPALLPPAAPTPRELSVKGGEQSCSWQLWSAVEKSNFPQRRGQWEISSRVSPGHIFSFVVSCGHEEKKKKKKEAEVQRMWCWEGRKEQREQPILKAVRCKPQAAGITMKKEPASRTSQGSKESLVQKSKGSVMAEKFWKCRYVRGP